MKEKEEFLGELADMIIVVLSMLLIHLVLSAFTGKWPWSGNPYNSYTLQACAWLEGRLDLGMNYEYLELAILGEKYFVSFPPFPSYLLLPFAALTGVNTPDGWIALFSILVGSIYAVKLFWLKKETRKHAVFWTLFLFLGTNVVLVTMDGWVWFIAQNLCLTLSLMAIYYAVKGKGGWSLFFWGCSVGCRPLQVLYFPILVYLLYRNLKEQEPEQNFWYFLKKKFYWAIPVGIIALSYMILNYARFGSITEFGHNYLPEHTRDGKGQFGIEFFAENLKNCLRLPVFTKEGKVQFYMFDGNAFWLVSPLFVSYGIYWIRGIMKKRKGNPILYFGIPLCIIVHMAALMLHRTMGGSHFGNRYLNDILPYIFLGIWLLIYEGDKKKEDVPEKEAESIEQMEKGGVIDDFIIKLQYPIALFGMALNVVGTLLYYNGWA